VELHQISAITSFDTNDPRITNINKLNLADFYTSDNKDIHVDKYGFPCTTFCGTTPQINKSWSGSWSTFWQEQRLQPLLTMLKYDKELNEIGQALVQIVPQIIGDDTSITPSLIHGDLCK
jgi:fructosamine-3-kinase